VRLTVRERILIHLAEHRSEDGEYRVPSDVTQSGLADAVGIAQKHVPQYVRTLISEGLLAERSAHVEGGRQRRKAYELTDRGRSEAAGLRGVLTDITERKRAEEALRETREELEAKAEHEMLRRNPYGLTFREHTVLHLVAAGESDRQIGTTLGISPLTAQKHVSNILAKMDASSRTEAGVRAVREGLIE